MAGAAQFARHQFGCATQVLCEPGLGQHGTVFSQLLHQRQHCGGHDRQANGQPDHQFDDRETALAPTRVHWFQQRWLAAGLLSALPFGPDAWTVFPWVTLIRITLQALSPVCRPVAVAVASKPCADAGLTLSW